MALILELYGSMCSLQHLMSGLKMSILNYNLIYHPHNQSSNWAVILLILTSSLIYLCIYKWNACSFKWSVTSKYVCTLTDPDRLVALTASPKIADREHVEREENVDALLITLRKSIVRKACREVDLKFKCPTKKFNKLTI